MNYFDTFSSGISRIVCRSVIWYIVISCQYIKLILAYVLGLPCLFPFFVSKKTSDEGKQQRSEKRNAVFIRHCTRRIYIKYMCIVFLQGASISVFTTQAPTYETSLGAITLCKVLLLTGGRCGHFKRVCPPQTTNVTLGTNLSKSL